jgi:prepilin-type N-terminal cleavage/methylation domain-containing protein
MKNSGFSLLELLITMALISILLGIAGVAANSMRNKYNVETQTKQMFADLLNARASAMAKNRAHFVDFASATQYAVYEDTDSAPDGDGSLDTDSDTQILLKNLEHGISRNGGQTVTFDTRGLVTSTGQTVWVTTPHGAGSDCITISATRITIGVSNGTENCVAQ